MLVRAEVCPVIIPRNKSGRVEGPLSDHLSKHK